MLLSKQESIVLSYPKLKERIESRENPSAEREKALKNLKEMRAEFSPAYINTLRKVLDSSLPKLYDGIDLHENGTDFRKLVDENCVVLVPNHQSHADYLAINYMVYKNYNFPLYVAGGINLNIFPIGKIFRKSGCFFIRRSFASDILYKLTLEAYLFYLLKQGKPIEFFFEGGRSRTGKLLPPRFGLYQMLLEAHRALHESGDERKLMFVPVSIAHEYVPETKSLAKELGGAKKKKESATQLLGLFKLFAYQFGNVHINMGRPIEADYHVIEENKDKLKLATQDLAFKCFREVGKNMVITPSSVLATVLLDEPSGALTWTDITAQAKAIIKYCKMYDLPFTDTLKEDQFEKTLERAMDILVGNRKVELIGQHHDGNTYYSIKKESRSELLYFKNTTLHHFLVPWIINAAWINLFNGNIKSAHDIRLFFLEQRDQLKHEFYLPTVKKFMFRALNVISDAIGRKVSTLDECLELSHQELYSLASKLGVFSKVLSYINEAYYITCLTITELMAGDTMGFKMDSFNKKYREVFDRELSIGRVIKYPESFSMPLLKSSMKYLTHMGLVENVDGMYRVTDKDKFDTVLKRYEKSLIDNLTFSIKAQ
ncbi:MAG: hypothetical protein CME70_17490 [Halobacteriovorax sp.]|nr:hypothetical protein [Halobacteriovorax sp.]|tara:strand:+ start:35569 stop:37368 length:1800 start_codon:yes stop_codon:yes gene_type:complete